MKAVFPAPSAGKEGQAKVRPARSASSISRPMRQVVAGELNR